MEQIDRTALPAGTPDQTGKRVVSIILTLLAGAILLAAVFLSLDTASGDAAGQAQIRAIDPSPHDDLANQTAAAVNIQGMVFNDINNNGRNDPDEIGIPLWKVHLTGSSGLITETLTEPGGRYFFVDLPAGTYTMTAEPKAGWLQTFPLLPGGVNYYTKIQVPGQTQHLDFGHHRETTDVISGMKWYDADGDGKKDLDEPGIPGWLISLLSTENPTVSQIAFTDERGIYEFTGMPTGPYSVTEVFRPGWIQTYPPTIFHGIHFTTGFPITNLDFGNKELNPGGIRGQKFNDQNGNGRRDEDESGIPNWPIHIRDAATNGSIYSDTRNSNAGGFYEFTGLISATYLISETKLPGWTQTYPPFEVYTMTFVPGRPIDGVDFGNYSSNPGSVNGIKFNDKNGNGRRDAGEDGLSNWKIILKGETVTGLTLEREAFTDGDGRYVFGNLPAGVYSLDETAQPGWIQTFPKSGFHNAVVVPGAVINGLDFGNGRTPLNEISGIKFHDRDGDGRQDSNEEPLEGWQIVLESSSGTSVTKTDSQGRYSFPDLPPDNYALSEVWQKEWQQTAGCLEKPGVLGEPPRCLFEWGTFPTFQTTTAVVNFGNRQPGPGKIKGLKFHDKNGNGRRDEGEPGLPGWTILLRGDGINLQVKTDANGRYEFPGLERGKYQLKEDPQAGWLQTFPMNNAEHTVFVDQGKVVDGVDFGNWDPAPVEVKGIKFHDKDGDGRMDTGEPALSGWTIILVGLEVKQKATTNTQGQFSFENLKPGPYLIYEMKQSGWAPTTPNGGYAALKLDPGAAAVINFGNWQPSPGSMTGEKWHDLDGDGRKEDGEPSLAGVTIRIAGDSGLARQQKTKNDGSYSFTNLPAGIYTVTEVITPGWQQTFPINKAHFVPLDIGETVNGINFGNWQPEPAEIHGVQWHDLDGNGLREPNEPGLVNWTIVATDSEGVSVETKTDAKGKYAIQNLLPGQYTVGTVQPPDWQQSFPLSETHQIKLSPNQIIYNLDLGSWKLNSGSIHGQKYEDRDSDGHKDANEFGLEGWVIKLVNEDGRIRSTTTDKNGNYAFTNLAPGKYKVGELLIYGWRQTFPQDGGHEINLSPSEAVVKLDFGNISEGGDYCLLPSNTALQEAGDVNMELHILIEAASAFNSPGTAAATEKVQLQVEFQGYPAGVMGSATDGPQQFKILGSNPFSVEPGTLASLSFTANNPFSSTGGTIGPAVFGATVTNLSTGESFGCVSTLWPAHPDFDQLPTPPEPLVLIELGEIINLVFNYTVTDMLPGFDFPALTAAEDNADTVVISYTISADSEGMLGNLPGIGLNGLPAGNNVQQTITVPKSIEGAIGVQVGFADEFPLGPTNLILKLDVGGDGSIDAVSSVVLPPPEDPGPVIPPPNDIYLPVIARK